jgi:hypothetical protein
MNAALIAILLTHSHEWVRDHADEEWERLYGVHIPRPADSVPITPRYDI